MAHKPAIPKTSILFEPVRDAYGKRLALVFGNEFKNGKCPFYIKNQCYHCDIGAGEGVKFTPEMNKERLNFFRRHYRGVLGSMAHLVIYNSGSTLNKAEMSRQTLGDIIEHASSLKKCKIVSFDSREMYVTEDSLDYIIGKLRKNQQARVILGIESQNDRIRIKKLNKTMKRENIAKAFEAVGRYKGKIGMDINILFQPPELVGEDAIKESVETLKYGLNLGKRHKVPVDFNFHPYYPSKRSKKIYPNHPRADFQDSKKALLRMKAEIEGRRSDAKIFIGWQDERHDQQQRIRIKELEKEMENFDNFNAAQDVKFLN
ncbi:hypothetical protein JXB01_00040 [Candidatus Micrarchaeota archaeon]|nr:hypothetical protein [Candidatus Micrarchaeota archaeon]